MKGISILLAIITTIIIYSCTQSQTESLKSDAKGKANDIVVVIEGPKWKSEPGNIIRGFITENVPGLPQEEPKFGYLFVPPTNFDKVYRRQRNIMITKIGAEHKKGIKINKDVWAKPQVVVTITAPNNEAFIELYREKGNEINDIIQFSELERLTNAYRAQPERKIIANLEKKHNINLVVPKGFAANIDTNNFVWLFKDYRDIIEGVLIYYYPYTDSNTFKTEFLLDKRNSLLKKYVEGEVRGSYMTTEEMYTPESKEFNLDGRLYTKEIRGLWKMKDGLAMGGPFVSISQYDEARKRIVTVEGFVFAPGHDKRNILRNVEAIVYSLQFP